jgi:hypothetical protein
MSENKPVIVPANPGFELLQYYDKEHGDKGVAFVDRTPIIAWKIFGEYREPITFATQHNDPDSLAVWGIAAPNGSFYMLDGRDYESFEGWWSAAEEDAECRRENWNRKQAYEAAKAKA